MPVQGRTFALRGLRDCGRGSSRGAAVLPGGSHIIVPYQVTAAAARQGGPAQQLPGARLGPIVQHMCPHLIQELAVLPATPQLSAVLLTHGVRTHSSWQTLMPLCRLKLWSSAIHVRLTSTQAVHHHL